MQKMIKELKWNIRGMCNEYAYWNRSDLVGVINPILPDIQEFVTQFIQTEDIGIEADIKSAMNSDLLGILKDIVGAMENKDSVLMFDALWCGLLEYLNLFVPEEDENE